MVRFGWLPASVSTGSRKDCPVTMPCSWSAAEGVESALAAVWPVQVRAAASAITLTTAAIIHQRGAEPLRAVESTEDILANPYLGHPNLTSLTFDSDVSGVEGDRGPECRMPPDPAAADHAATRALRAAGNGSTRTRHGNGARSASRRCADPRSP